MRAVTVLPPWGSAILLWGKQYENRGLPPPPCIRERPFLIHQGRLAIRRDGQPTQNPEGRRLREHVPWVAAQVQKSEAEILEILRAQESRLLCVVRVTEWFELFKDHAVSQQEHPGRKFPLQPWMMPRPDRRVFAWRLDQMTPLPDLVACRGMQGVWSVDIEWKTPEA